MHQKERLVDQKRSIDLRNFRLEYLGWKGEKYQGKVLLSLVYDNHQKPRTSRRDAM